MFNDAFPQPLGADDKSENNEIEDEHPQPLDLLDNPNLNARENISITAYTATCVPLDTIKILITTLLCGLGGDFEKILMGWLFRMKNELVAENNYLRFKAVLSAIFLQDKTIIQGCATSDRIHPNLDPQKQEAKKSKTIKNAISRAIDQILGCKDIKIYCKVSIEELKDKYEEKVSFSSHKK